MLHYYNKPTRENRLTLMLQIQHWCSGEIQCIAIHNSKGIKRQPQKQRKIFSLQKLQCMHKLGRLARLQQSQIMQDREKA